MEKYEKKKGKKLDDSFGENGEPENKTKGYGCSEVLPRLTADQHPGKDCYEKREDGLF